MKKKQLQELRKPESDLVKELTGLEAKKRELEASLLRGKEKNVKALGIVRRDIAQILTLMGEKKK